VQETEEHQVAQTGQGLQSGHALHAFLSCITDQVQLQLVLEMIYHSALQSTKTKARAVCVVPELLLLLL